MNETIKKIFEIIYNNGPDKFPYKLESLCDVNIKENSIQLDFYEGILEIPIKEPFNLLGNRIEDNFSDLFILECINRLKYLSDYGKKSVKDSDYVCIMHLFSSLSIDTHIFDLRDRIIQVNSETCYILEDDLAAQWLSRLIKDSKLIYKS